MSLQDQLALESLDLEVGESKRIQCPKCRAEDEKSMKLTRTQQGYVATCFRAKCGYRTYQGIYPAPLEMYKKTPGLTTFSHPTAGLSTSQRRYLDHKYGIWAYEIRQNGIVRQLDQPRLVMPIFDKDGDKVGYVAKKMGACKGPKSITYWHKERPGLHYPRQTLSKGPVALCEDTLSSIRVARYMRSRALLGTYLSDLAIEQLSKETDTIILALDNDVVGLMSRYAQRLRGIFKVHIIVWPKDPKDMLDEDVKECLCPYLS